MAIFGIILFPCTAFIGRSNLTTKARPRWDLFALASLAGLLAFVL
jgi:hypothetical protein